MKRTGVYLRIILSLTAFTFYLHVVPGNVSAQTTNGMIQGTVHDESGAPIAGVSVSLKSIETGALRVPEFNCRRIPGGGQSQGL